MTKKEFIEKYGDVEVKFNNYYKYSFYYTGQDGDLTLSVSYGGSSDDIYRHSVDTNPIAIKAVYPRWGEARRGEEIIDEFNDDY